MATRGNGLRRAVRAVTACGVLLAAGCGTVAADTTPRHWRVGDCVRPSPAAAAHQRYVPAGCSDRRAGGRVVAVLRGTRVHTDPACAATADGVISAPGTVVCVRNLRPPHPGDPGHGGGLIGPGDCIVLRSGRGREVPCAHGHWYGKVVARAATTRDCPRPRTWAIARGHDALPPVLCLGRGGKVLAPGDCVAGVGHSPGAPHRVRCSARTARARIITRVDTPHDCPHGTTRYLKATGGYLPVACLRRVAQAR